MNVYEFGAVQKCTYIVINSQYMLYADVVDVLLLLLLVGSDDEEMPKCCRGLLSERGDKSVLRVHVFVVLLI